MNRAGFSPHQRVFGISARTPTSLMCTDQFDPVMARSSPSESFHKSESLRQTVAKAWLELDSKNRLAAALRGRNRRCAPQVSIGEAVYVWRQPQGQRGSWQGPGLVTMTSDKATWVSMRHSLWKVPPEHIRPATPHEALGIEVLSKYMSSMQEELANLDSRRGPKGYIDGMREPGPHDEESSEQVSVPAEPNLIQEPVHEETSREQRPELDDDGAEDQGQMQVEEGTTAESLADADQGIQGEQEQTAGERETQESRDSTTPMREEVEERSDFRAEADIMREVLRSAPSLAELQRRESTQESSLTQLLRQSALASASTASLRRPNTELEHPDSPERQRPRRQIYPYPTPSDWHEAGAGSYLQQVVSDMVPTECMFEITRTGRNAKTAVTTDKDLPKFRDCKHRITVDWATNQVLEDLDLRRTSFHTH
eukprot:5904500-Amphidinium_carterae.2